MKSKSSTKFKQKNPSIYTILAISAVLLMVVAIGASAISISNVTKTNNISPISPAPNTPKGPNFLVVILDDVGVEQIAAYNEGTNPANTPNINALAQSGMLFRNAYSSPLCTPTRAGLQTGRYAFRTGIGNLIQPDTTGYTLSRSELILPEMLDVGTNGAYASALFGKWHLGNQSNGGIFSPNVMGYDYYSGHLGNLLDADTYFQWTKTVNGVQSPKSGYITSDTVDDTIAWTRSQTKPWLAVVAFHAPHSPFHVPPAHLHTVSNPTSNVLKYKAMLEALDTELGRLIQSLRQSGQYTNTTIIVIGDNGTPQQASSTPFKAKGTLYEGGINVPFIVKSPLISTPGTESDAFVQTLDIFSTIAEIAGVDVGQIAPTTKIDSISLVPYFTSASAPSIRPYGFSEFFNPIGSGNGAIPSPPGMLVSKKVMRDDRYKLHLDLVTQAEEFYDLLLDPAENTNLLISGLVPGSPEELAYTKLKADIIALVNS